MTEISTRVRRGAHKQRADRHQLDAILDANQIAHIAVVDGDTPLCIPMAYVRDDDAILIHGSTGSRLMRLLASGASATATVTCLDGLVVARSAFHSSMHYRCAMVFGSCRVADNQLRALELLTDGLIPGRWNEVRPTATKELAATVVVELPLARWSVKVSDGQPNDDRDDISGDTWAGIVPVETRYGQPRPAADLRPGISLPTSVARLIAGTPHA